MRSLRWRLALGFALTVVIAVGLTGAMAAATTAQRFDLLISEVGRARAEAIAPLLAAEYRYWGDWQTLAEQRILRPRLSQPSQFFLFPSVHTNPLESMMNATLLNRMTANGMAQNLSRPWGQQTGASAQQNAAADDWLNLALQAAGVQSPEGVEIKEHQSGWSLNELAQAGGEDTEHVVQLIIGAEKTAIDDAVRGGQLDPESARLYLEVLPEQVRAFLNTMRVQRFGPRVEVVSPPQLTVEGSNWLLEELLLGEERLLIADATGRVLIDSAGEVTGQTLGEAALNAGAPVIVNGRRVGTVLVGAELGLYDAEQRAFIAGVTTSVALSALLAGAAALVVGLVIAAQITGPVRELTVAAERIAGGDLSQRVPVRSQDELGQMSAAFNRMAEEISTQRMLRSRLVDDIAHELNTPLSLIGLELQAMADGLQTPEEAAIQLRREVAELQALTSDLAYLADSDGDGPALELTSVPLNALVQEVAGRFGSQAATSGVNLRLDLCPDAPALMLDEARIARALTNLLSNALRHTPEGGQITVTTACADGEALVTVRDTGEGIPEADLPHIWERFYRADRSRSRDTGGRGLGLAIVRQAVELHGGRVWVESKVGEGSTFGLALKLDGGAGG